LAGSGINFEKKLSKAAITHKTKSEEGQKHDDLFKNYSPMQGVL
jgi:hypothetical protein